ncbi:MAG: phospholipid carrier-dependent glycosyltransferase [Thermosphaera sp.]
MKVIEEKPLLALLLVPLIFAIMRGAYIPLVWPEKAAGQCIFPPYDGCGFIFDEAHYIPAVRRMLRGEAVNLEHPPLSKYLIILGILLLGDNPWGWRLPMVAFSALTVYLVGLIAYRLSGSIALGVAGQLLLAADVTFFNIGGLALLDPPALALMMLSLYLYFTGRERWAGIALGLALLAKSSMYITAFLAFPLMAIAYPLVNYVRLDLAIQALRHVVRWIVLPAVLVFLIGLGAWNASILVYPTPLHFMGFMLQYHSILSYQDPTRVELPLSWIIPPITRQPSPYFVAVAGNWRPIEFWGVSSPLWWSIWILAPLSFSWVRRGRPLDKPCPELDLLSWTAATYGAFLVIAYALKRWVYIFYFLQVSVFMAALAPVILSRNGYAMLLKVLVLAQLLWMLLFLPAAPQWLAELLNSLGLGEAPWM